MAALARALASLLRHYRTYRPYSLQGRVNERRWWTLAAARGADGAACAALDLLLQALPGQAPAETELRVRFGQLAAPLNAKSVEDTGFYRYFRLLSRNEVGSDPQRLGMEGRELLEHAAGRLRRHPRALLALATHDQRRADSRARLAVLSLHGRVAGRGAALGPDGDPRRRANAIAECRGLCAMAALVAAWPMHGTPAQASHRGWGNG